MTDTKCLTCHLDDKRAAGLTLTQQESNHWSLWGCTCSPEDLADAVAWMDLVTR